MERPTTTAEDASRAPIWGAAPSPPPRRIGDLLLEAGLVSDAQLQRALAAQADRRMRLGEILREDGVIDDIALAAVLAVHLDAPLVDLRDRPSEEEALRLVPEADAHRLAVLPLTLAHDELAVAMDDPANTPLVEELARLVGHRVRPLLALRSEIEQTIPTRYRMTSSLSAQVQAFTSTRPAAAAAARTQVVQMEGLDRAPVVQIVNLLVAQALRDRASDLHLEPQADGLRVRTRVDGILYDAAMLPAELAPGLASRIKIMADLNIVEKQRAQDGQISLEIEGRRVDVRVATMRTIHGEKVVMRLLDKARSVFRLDELGAPAADLPAYQRLLHAPFGMVVVSGPTGSGKTTTLYASINELDRVALNVTTIEDPVEYTFERINQTQVNTAAGITFAAGLRAILRQDPDIILVGEVRDQETAEIAVQAALTGHLVLSSMHATDAVGTVFRLLEMGVEPFLVAASVTGVVAQRLMRRVCPHCRIEVEPTLEERALYSEAGLEPPPHGALGRGCTYCGGTGFFDRIGVFELLRVTPAVRHLIAGDAHYEEIRQAALAEGMTPLRVDALRKAASGLTTVAEAIRSIS